MDIKIELGRRILDARKRAPVRLTQAELARRLDVTPQAISGWERGESMPDALKLGKLADELGVSLLWLLRKEDANDPKFSEHYLEHYSRELFPEVKHGSSVSRQISGQHLVGAQDFPIYAAAEGGNGTMIVHTDVMEYVKRPIILEGVPESYGISIVGTSMVPAYREGDMALVHPRRPPERDTDVILYDHDHRTGDAKAMIKHLATFNDRSWKLEQYNPVKTFSEHRADWPICHQVVGMYKGRR